MPEQTLPQRNSLVAQTAAFLRARIDSGTWRNWLPDERSLSHLLQVSRNTVRAALAQLRSEGLIRSVHGSGNEIVGQIRQPAKPASNDVALLTPEPIERLRHIQSLWIDEMRSLLSERGLRMHAFHGHQYFTPKPSAALKKLVTRNHHGCWILMLAGESVQRWFGDNDVPCVVAGSTYPGVDLPSSDRDHRAMCRHAVGVLRGLGHESIALLTEKSPRAGDLESVAGFIEGTKGLSRDGTDAIVIHHESTVPGVLQALRRLMKIKPTPTALLITNSYCYLTVYSRLSQYGIRMPQDVSMISRDDDPFLSFLVPQPSHYVVSPQQMAKNLLRPALELLNGDTVTQRTFRIIPKFIRGDSIAPPSKVTIFEAVLAERS